MQGAGAVGGRKEEEEEKEEKEVRVVNEETCWARENERVRSVDQGWCGEDGGSGVCPGKKSIQSDRDNVFV